MNPWQSRGPAWGLSLLAATLISSTQGIAFHLSFFLRQRGLLRLGVWMIVAALGIYFLDRWWSRNQEQGPPSRRSFGCTAIGFVGIAFVVVTSRNPSEAFHAVGVLALSALVWKALEFDVRPSRRPWSCFGIVAAYGLLDEIIQHFHPLRYFDLDDVLLNVGLAFLSNLVLTGYHQVLDRTARSN